MSAGNHAEQPGSAVQGEVAAYGIIDPDYARVFTIARCLAWAEGYSLAMQGSFTRDLDLLAVPWTDSACEPEHLARRIEEAASLRITHPSKDGEKPHGRLVWTMKFKTFGDPRFVDLSIMPRTTPPPAPAAEPPKYEDLIRYVTQPEACAAPSGVRVDDAVQEACTDILHKLDSWAEAYPESAFGPVTEAEREEHGSLISRASASMGRHMSRLIRGDLAKLRAALAGKEG